MKKILLILSVLVLCSYITVQSNDKINADLWQEMALRDANELIPCLDKALPCSKLSKQVLPEKNSRKTI